MFAYVVVVPVCGSGADVEDCVSEYDPSGFVVGDVEVEEPSWLSVDVDSVPLLYPSSLRQVPREVVVVEPSWF